MWVNAKETEEAAAEPQCSLKRAEGIFFKHSMQIYGKLRSLSLCVCMCVACNLVRLQGLLSLVLSDRMWTGHVCNLYELIDVINQLRSESENEDDNEYGSGKKQKKT